MTVVHAAEGTSEYRKMLKMYQESGVEGVIQLYGEEDVPNPKMHRGGRPHKIRRGNDVTFVAGYIFEMGKLGIASRGRGYKGMRILYESHNNEMKDYFYAGYRGSVTGKVQGAWQ